MGRPSKRFAVFLCLLVLHQDFINARTQYDNQVLSSAAYLRSRRQTSDEMDDDVHKSLVMLQSHHNITVPSTSLRRGKRFLGLFLFIVSLVVTIVATVVETIYDIAGCCGLGYKFLCGFESDFNSRKESVKRRSEEVDRQLEDALQKRDSLECLAIVLETLWSNIRELVLLEEEFLGTIQPAFKAVVLAKKNQIKNDVKKLTTFSETEINDIIAKMSKTKKIITLSVGWTSAALPGIGMLATKVYDRYKINKIYKALKATKLEPLLKASSKAQKLLGFSDDAAKLFLRQTAIARYSSKASTMMKGLKFFKFAGAIVSVISIAMDLFNMINTFIACDKKDSEARKTIKEVEKAEKEVQNTENSVKEFKKLLQEGLTNKLVKEFRSPDLHSAFLHVKDTIHSLPKNNSQRTWDIEQCVADIPVDLKFFMTSSRYEDIKDRLIALIDHCIAPMKYAYECLLSRTRMITEINKGCRNGDGDFNALYAKQEKDERTTMARCIKKGEPYTTEPMLRTSVQEYVKAKAKELTIFYPCRMNNAMTRKTVCEENAKGTSASQIADRKDMDLTTQQVETLIGKICSDKSELTADQKENICSYKSVGFDSATIVDYVKGVTVAQVEALQCTT